MSRSYQLRNPFDRTTRFSRALTLEYSLNTNLIDGYACFIAWESHVFISRWQTKLEMPGMRHGRTSVGDATRSDCLRRLSRENARRKLVGIRNPNEWSAGNLAVTSRNHKTGHCRHRLYHWLSVGPDSWLPGREVGQSSPCCQQRQRDGEPRTPRSHCKRRRTPGSSRTGIQVGARTPTQGWNPWARILGQGSPLQRGEKFVDQKITPRCPDPNVMPACLITRPCAPAVLKFPAQKAERKLCNCPFHGLRSIGFGQYAVPHQRADRFSHPCRDENRRDFVYRRLVLLQAS